MIFEAATLVPLTSLPRTEHRGVWPVRVRRLVVQPVDPADYEYRTTVFESEGGLAVNSTHDVQIVGESPHGVPIPGKTLGHESVHTEEATS